MKCIILQCCISLYLREPSSHGSYATVFLFQFIFYEFHAGPTFFLGKIQPRSTSTHLCNLALLLNYYDRLISHCDVLSTAAVSLMNMSKTLVEFCFNFLPHICCLFFLERTDHASFPSNGIVSSCQKDAQGAAAGQWKLELWKTASIKCYFMCKHQPCCHANFCTTHPSIFEQGRWDCEHAHFITWSVLCTRIHETGWGTLTRVCT